MVAKISKTGFQNSVFNPDKEKERISPPRHFFASHCKHFEEDNLVEIQWIESGNDVDPGNRSRVNESPQPAQSGRGLHHETHQALSGTDHPQAENRRATDRPGQDRRRGLPRDRGDPADLSPLETAVRRHAGRGSQAADPAGEGKCPAQEASGGGRAGESHAQRPCRGKLLSPERRRRAVTVLQERYRASERFVCRVAGQHRSTQRHGGKVVDIEEAKLRHRLREIAAEHIRWGRRMAYRLLRREGWTVNHKRVQRLWREEGLQRPLPGSASGHGPPMAR